MDNSERLKLIADLEEVLDELQLDEDNTVGFVIEEIGKLVAKQSPVVLEPANNVGHYTRALWDEVENVLRNNGFNITISSYEW